MFFDFLFNKDKKIDYSFCSKLAPNEYKKYLMELYKQKMGYSFNLKKPKTLNETIQYLKLYDNLPIKEFLTDKANVYDYLSKKLGSNRMVKELYKIYDSPEEINYDELPNRFMLNQNNYSKVHLPILNKQIMTEENKNTVYEFYKHWFGRNYAFVNGFELQYKNIKPKIIVERLYPKVSDWQVLCVKGEPLFVCFYDEKNHIYDKIYKLNDKGYLLDNIPQKKIVDEFIEISRELSKNFKLVRVDFIVIDNTYPFFCEFTFTPYSGYAAKNIIEYNSKDYADICADIVRDKDEKNICLE